MTSSRPARASIHRTRIRKRRVAALLIFIAGAAVLGDQVLATSSPSAPSPDRVATSEQRAPRSGEHRDRPRDPRSAPSQAGGAAADGTTADALGVGDGAVPDGTTVFDDGVPGVANLDPALLAAVRQAGTDAADEGLTFLVHSGWRSPAYQQHLLDEAVLKYGSEEQAARWVARPGTSAHVSGDAVDLGPAAAAWLSQHGAEYGLCQTYANESWHYELRPEAVGGSCPPMYPNPTHDPRMNQ